MSNGQPEALRLADALENLEATATCSDNACLTHWSEEQANLAAAELRRLHAEIERLRAALELVACQDQGCGGNVTEAEAWRSAQAIARATLKEQQ